jgi:hypothetical protein
MKLLGFSSFITAFLLCSPLYAASDFCGHHFYTISEAEANQGNGWEPHMSSNIQVSSP